MRLGSPLATIRALWGDIYPANKPRKHSLIEKLFLTLITILPVLSLSNIRPQQPTTLRHVFMDIYVLAWATLLCLALTFCSTYPTIATLIAAYRLYDIVTYRLYFLFVKSQERPWTRD